MNRIRISAVIAGIILLLTGCGASGGTAAEVQIEDIEGFISAESFGAYPSDSEDDTDALREALESGKNVYLSKGEYRVSGTLTVKDQQLVGGGNGITRIISSCEDASKPIFDLSGSGCISAMNISYSDKLITYNEKEGERVGILLGGESAVVSGARIEGILFSYVGTAIIAPESSKGCSNLMIDTCFVSIFTYGGISLDKSGQYGNSLSNVYIGGNVKIDHAREFGLRAAGQDNLTVGQLNLEHMYFNDALLLQSCNGVIIESLHMEAIGQTAEGTGNIRIENSNVMINGMTLYYNPMDYKNLSVIQLGSSDNNKLDIGILHLKGLNNVNAANGEVRDYGLKNPDAAGFKVISRKAGATGEYSVNVKSYVWYTWYGEDEIYSSFPCDTQGINYISKGIR